MFFTFIEQLLPGTCAHYEEQNNSVPFLDNKKVEFTHLNPVNSLLNKANWFPKTSFFPICQNNLLECVLFEKLGKNKCCKKLLRRKLFFFSEAGKKIIRLLQHRYGRWVICFIMSIHTIFRVISLKKQIKDGGMELSFFQHWGLEDYY